MDDILSFPRGFQNMIKNLDVIFYRLMTFGFKLKPEKLSLAKSEVPMLGFVLKGPSVGLSTSKLRTTETWPTPSNKDEVVSFVSFCNFLRRHVERFSALSKPLYDLASKETKEPFVWTNKANEAFLALKKAISTAPCLKLPRPGVPLFLFTDYLKLGLGYFLA